MFTSKKNNDIDRNLTLQVSFKVRGSIFEFNCLNLIDKITYVLFVFTKSLLVEFIDMDRN